MRSRIVLATAVLLAGVVGAAPTARAAAGTTYRVGEHAVCGGPGTFQDALARANAHPGRDTIAVDFGLVWLDLSPCWRPNMPFPFGLQATDAVDVIGNGVRVEGNQYFLDPNGERNNPKICPSAQGSPPTNWISYSTGFLQVGTYNTDNSSVAVSISGMNFHNINSLFKVEKSASLTMSDSRAWEIDAFLAGCNRPVIETAYEGANVKLTQVQIDHGNAPGAGTGEYDIAAVVQGGHGGNLVLDRVFFAANNRGRAVSWLGTSVKIVSSKFVDSGGMFLSTDSTQIVNSAFYISGTKPSDRFYTDRGQVSVLASTFYWAWENPTCVACTLPGMGFLAMNGTVRFATSAIGASATSGAGAALLVGTAGAFSSDALTWVQPTADSIGPSAISALLPNAKVDPPGLTPTALPWLSYESAITPLLGSPGAPGVLIDAVPDAQPGGTNQLLDPMTGLVITKDVFGNPRTDANDTRNIGAVQVTLAPRLSAMGTTVHTATLGWTRPDDPASGAITGYAVFYRVKGSAAKYTRADVAGAGTLTVQVGGLRADTSYEFKVVGVNAAGDGPPSNIVAARTPAEAPLPAPEPILSHLDYQTGLGVVGTPISALNPHVTPAGQYRYRVTAGSLPPGLTLDPGTGIISGTPTKAGRQTLTVQASGPNGTVTARLTITISAVPTAVPTAAPTAAPSATPGAPPSAAPGTATQPSHLDYPLGRATRGTPIDPLSAHTAFIANPLTYSMTSGSLPPGLALDPATGTISGTPAAAGVFEATITVVGSGGATATSVARIEIASPDNLLTVVLKAVAHGDKLKLSILGTCPAQSSFRLQKLSTTSNNGGSDEPTTTTTWRTLPKTYKTHGANHSRTINQPKGSYRALVGGSCLFSDTQSQQATLRK